jgi:hypothetical protein
MDESDLHSSFRHVTFRHVKTGHIAKIVHLGRLQKAPETQLNDMDRMVVYIHDDKFWVRSEAEFLDGRFEKLERGPK